MTWSSSPTPNTSRPGVASRRSRSTWAGVRSWSSSTSRWRHRACACRRQLAVAQQELDGAVHLLVEVDDSRGRQLPPVRIEGGGQAGDVVPLGLHLLRIAQPEADQRQRLQVGTDGVGVEPAALGGHELRDQPADLALVQHARRPAVRLGEEGVAERVERLDARPEVGRAGLHLLLGPLVVGHGQHALALEAPVDDQVAEPLRQHPRLARARRRDHPRRTGPVGDGGQLVGGQLRGRRAPGQGRG